MANMTVINNISAGIVVWDPVYEDNIFNDPVTGVYLAGTILGRIATSGKLIAYKSTNDDGSQVPVALLQNKLDFVGDIDISFRPIIAGRVRREDIVVHRSSDIITNVEFDALRDYGIISFINNQLDN